MPARPTLVQGAPEAAGDSLRKDLETSLRKHLGVLTRVAIERRRQGVTKGSPNRWLGQDVEVRRATGETDDELVASVLDEVCKLIELDADGSPWLGRVHLYNDTAEKKSDRDLAQVDVRVEDGNELATAASESVAIVQTVRVFLTDMCKEFVKILGATAARESATAAMVESITKRDAKMEAAGGKWAYRMKKEDSRVESEKIKETGKTARSRARWEGIVDFTTEHKDVVKSWSDLFVEAAREAKSTATISPPTQAEIDAVFSADEQFDALRALASEMIAESDYNARRKLSKRFKDAVMALPSEMKQLLMLRAANALGQARAQECFKWLSRPRAA